MIFRKLKPEATLPTRGTKYSAGYDLYAIEDCTIYGTEQALISTGIGWEPNEPEELEFKFGRISPRSGLAVKFGLNVLAGIVDADYTGEIRVALINHRDSPYTVKKGDRIAQLIISPYYVTSDDTMNEVVRGDSGYGSTGK